MTELIYTERKKDETKKSPNSSFYRTGYSHKSGGFNNAISLSSHSFIIFPYPMPPIALFYYLPYIDDD